MLAVIFLYIFGLILLIESLLLIFFPAILKKTIRIFLNFPFWVWGIVSVVFGVFLWFSVSRSLSPCLVKAFTLISFLKGLFLLFVPKKDFEKTIDWSLNLSDLTYRILGILFLPVAIYFLLRIV